MKKIRGNQKGFTLIELIVVMAIIGILVLLATPKFLNYIKDANVVALQTDSKVIGDAVLYYNLRRDEYPIDSLEAEVPDNVKEVLKANAIETGRVFGESDSIERLDIEKLSEHIRNTRNKMEDYLLITSGDYEGEVIYNKVLEDSVGNKHIGIIFSEKEGE